MDVWRDARSTAQPTSKHHQPQLEFCQRPRFREISVCQHFESTGAIFYLSFRRKIKNLVDSFLAIFGINLNFVVNDAYSVVNRK